MATFEEQLATAVEKFRQLPRNARIRVVSHLDADGICACAILLKALDRENRNYSISIVQQLNEAVLKGLAKEDYSVYFVTDLGSGQLEHIKAYFNGKQVFVLDHHTPQEIDLPETITHVNPHLSGIDGGTDISGAGVVFRFTYALTGKKDMAHIAIIGAIGDVQDKTGFKPMNQQILQMAVEEGRIQVKRGLRIFGMQTRPIHKALEYCTDPYIPGVSGSESGAIQFLQQMGINPKKGSQWKKLIDLTEPEMQRLTAGIIMQRKEQVNPEDIIGNIYLLSKEKEESPLRDAKEFATLLNSCGRMNKASIGIGVCLGDETAKRRALASLDEYKKEIVKALNWYRKNKESEHIIKDKGYMIIHAKEHIRPSMAGTVASILSNANDIPRKTFLLSLARNSMEGTTKVSLRITGRHQDINLRDIIDQVIQRVPGAEAGGHHAAAGAIIPTEQEDMFIRESTRIFQEKGREEIIG